MFNIGIANIEGQSTNTVKKTFIRITDGSEITLVNVRTHSSWVGNGTNYSIGLETRGRELVRTYNCEWAADQPMVFSQNPRDGGSTIDIDFFTFTNTYCLPTPTRGQYSVTFATNLRSVHEIVFNGLIMAGGTGGITWINPAPTQDCVGFTIRNCRIEQQTDVNAYFLNVDFTLPHLMYDIHLENCSLGSNQHGIRLRGCSHAFFDTMMSAVTDPTKNVVDLNGSIPRIGWRNFWTNGTTGGKSIVGLFLEGGRGRFSSVDYTILPDATYSNTDTGAEYTSRLNLTKATGIIQSGSTALEIHDNADLNVQLLIDNATGNAAFRDHVSITGGLAVGGAFGCNGNAEQPKIATGAALNAYAAGVAGLAAAGDMAALVAKVQAIDAAFKLIGHLKV